MSNTLEKNDLERLDSLRITQPRLWKYIREVGQSVLILQKERDEARASLIRISKYETTENLRKISEKTYELPYEEALEMAYENILVEASVALKK